ncbi:hypothetical protein IQ226_20420 [Dolichospermum sp. LEGE 00240]|jgi:hypothetical protein|uniref:hypothetical protein n=1 Tax=Dolichospermum sp. LEGE 00240 TaxID=1828603 RepID=UPI00188188CB|nr:hypothetical protein [Dolichospermum sp. LEGE 00240]MBE9251446.1 hypothetical protein [Dolichospermum sp. LEGE 00240]MDM3857331.1 hypothetical protein [Aphanizomenon gracile PMC649.10]MDM3858858.1 hypothetical protein [Aphanizomenon gracile PMC644.10]
MTTSKTAEYIVHFDDDSFGVYEFPCNVYKANPAENPPPNLPKFNLGSFKYARFVENQIEVFGQITPIGKDGRIVINSNKPTTHYLIGSPFTAPVVLLQYII